MPQLKPDVVCAILPSPQFAVCACANVQRARVTKSTRRLENFHFHLTDFNFFFALEFHVDLSRWRSSSHLGGSDLSNLPEPFKWDVGAANLQLAGKPFASNRAALEGLPRAISRSAESRNSIRRKSITQQSGRSFAANNDQLDLS